MSNHKGFTIIELMIVVGIIAILAAIAIPNYISYRNNSYCAAMKSDAATVYLAVADYFANPENTTLSKERLNIMDGPGGKLSFDNTFSVALTGTNKSVEITITDQSGKCSEHTYTRYIE